MHQQSPIDIDPTEVKELVMDDSTGKIELTIGRSDGFIEHGGSNFKVHWNGGNNSVLKLRDGREFHPIQFHFHTPSEHTVEGKAFPFCMHLVHQSKDGQLAVVGVFFEDGEESEFLAQFWDLLAEAEPRGEKIAVKDIHFDSLKIDNESFYRYEGSLTTPPYTEGVEWVIVKDPRTVSAAQIQHFIDVIPADSNARDLQPLEGAAGRVLFCCEA
ncbi:hypothetical protein LEN26_007569 [Aphanomyces euteiches]|nr:hypothetical protein AeMF1_003287 [Aphanomyces euteiches]KAH9131899.1 hypothetical protein LEN26_007569 [Aphanomyces euteiches]